jgi:hypothetical protein
MGQSAEDMFVLDVLGVDVRKYLPPGEDLDAVMPPVTPPPAPPPPGPADAWGTQAATHAAVAKQIAALKVLGSAEADDFAKSLHDAEQNLTAKPDDALKTLAALAAQVKAAFDKQRAPKAPTPEEVAARKTAATKVTSVAGHGTADDTALVVNELQKMPKGLLDALDKNGTKLKVCRGSVTDYMTDLKGVQPRGWPEGKTWDSVPGLQRPDSKEVVIATIGHDSGKPHVPKTGEGHGADNLVIHETAHGVDFAADPHISTTKPFNDARDPDKGALSAYETQPDPAGQQETFAESCARYFTDDPSSAQDTPHLHKYWRDNPIAVG